MKCCGTSLPAVVGVKNDTHVRGASLLLRVLKMIPMFAVSYLMLWVLKIVPVLPEIFHCAQDGILVIINALCGDAGVKNDTRVRSGVSVSVGVKNSTRISGVALLLRVLKLVPINTQLYVCFGC